jgi:hypothetical protein
MTTYSNPRTEATVEEWPSGKRRVTAAFTVEQIPQQGERAVRTSAGKPKTLTYASKVRIVDGDDGRIYIACLTTGCATISIVGGTMDRLHEDACEGNPRFAELAALFA